MFHDSSFRSLSPISKGKQWVVPFSYHRKIPRFSWQLFSILISDFDSRWELILLTLEISKDVKLVIPNSYHTKIPRVFYIPTLYILLTLEMSKGLKLVCYYSYGKFSRMKYGYVLILIMGKFQGFHDSFFRYLAQMLTLGIFLE